MNQRRWCIEKFNELTPHALYAVLRARSQVFVIEQQCLYLDQDNLDQHSLHICCWQADTLLAYARIVPAGLSFEEVSIGRVLTTDAARGQGLGKTLMTRALDACAQYYPQQPIRIGAQDYLRNFYQNLGFTLASDVYDEDGIPHVEMIFSTQR